METVVVVVLVVVLGGFGALVGRSIRRRKDFLQTVLPDDVELPDITTDLRYPVTLRRLWRDTQQGLALVEALHESLRLTFCPTDHGRNAERYKTGIGKEAEVALFGLATLAPGGIEALKDQIVGADPQELHPDRLLFLRQGQFDNDHVVVCRILGVRETSWGELALVVYRAQVQETLVLELAVPNEPTQPFLTEGSLAHGSARLFGYLNP